MPSGTRRRTTIEGKTQTNQRGEYLALEDFHGYDPDAIDARRRTTLLPAAQHPDLQVSFRAQLDLAKLYRLVLPLQFKRLTKRMQMQIEKAKREANSS